MTYRSCRKALLLSLVVCLSAPASFTFAAEQAPDSAAKAPTAEPAAAPAAPAAKEAPVAPAQAPKESADKEKKTESSLKPKKDQMSDMQRRHAGEGYYGKVHNQNSYSDTQKRHGDEGYYTEVKPYVAPPPEAKPEAPLAAPISVGPPPLVVPAVRPAQPGDRKFDDDTGNTGSVTATRHAKQGKDLFATGHFDLAKRHFHESLETVPTQLELYPMYWESCAKTNDWGEARRALEKFFEADPTKKKDYAWAYAQTWFELKNWEKAVPALKEALKYGSHADELHGDLLKIALHNHNNVDIATEYAALLKIKPSDYKTQLDFANWLEVQQRHSEAIPHYKAAVNSMPGDGATAGRLAYMLIFYNKDYRQAITYYKIASTGDPTNFQKYQEGIKYAEAQMKSPAAPAASKPKREQQ